MLQIISGKFFKNDDRHVFPAKGIIYSNFSWVDSIVTPVGTLEPVDYTSLISSYVFNYTNQIEKEEGGVLVRAGDSEIIEQFQLLCTFGLKAFFSVEKDEVLINCREKPRNYGDQYIPSLFTERIFDSKINAQKEDIDEFIDFVDKVIGLPRIAYKSIIQCFKNYYNSLHILNYNLDLAYSILVYSLESLATNWDEYEPTWEDYDPKIKDDLDSVMENIEAPLSENIKGILVSSAHFRLQQRFINFIVEYIDDSFFIEEAENRKMALKKSELKRILQNTYTLRSQYTHSLKPILEQLKVPAIAEGDVFHWEKEPYLTYSGLVRLTHHVFSNFIYMQDYLEEEDYNWRDDIPNVVKFKVSPEYWIHNKETFTPSNAKKRFSGFLSVLEKALYFNKPIVNLRDLLEYFEKCIPTSKKEDKISMLAMYGIYNSLVHETEKNDKYKKIMADYNSLYNACEIEMIIYHIIVLGDFPCDVETCARIYEDYNRFAKNSIDIPFFIDINIMLSIANAYLQKDETGKYEYWGEKAYFESAGKPKLQATIKEAIGQHLKQSLDQNAEVYL